jgi:tetratricopeptide (TPR) repeat protein
MRSRKTASNVTRALFICIVSFLLIFSRINSVFASDITYQRDYSYQASESDSKISCRTIALEQVKRLLLEELGSYLVSQTEVKDFQISRDQVNAMTAGVVRTEVLKENWDGKTYFIVAKITTDPSQVAKALDELRKDKQGVNELEEVKKRTQELLIGLEKLRKELRSSKGGERTKEKKEYMAAANKLGAVDWFKEGYALAQSKKYRDAISFYNKAIDADPEYADAYSGRGLAYFKIKDYQQSLKDLNRAIAVKPEYPGALTNRALTLIALKEYNKALIDVNRSIELKPEYARAYNVRSGAYINLRNNQKAIEDCNKAIELNPNFPEAYVHRGTAQRNIEKYEDALNDFQKAIGINPADPDVYDHRGYTYFLLKKYDDALRDINKALELDQSSVRALYRRGLVYNQLKNYEGAIRDFSKAIELEKDYANAYYHRSLSYKRIGKVFESANDLKKAAQLGNVQAQNALK